MQNHPPRRARGDRRALGLVAAAVVVGSAMTAATAGATPDDTTGTSEAHATAAAATATPAPAAGAATDPTAHAAAPATGTADTDHSDPAPVDTTDGAPAPATPATGGATGATTTGTAATAPSETDWSLEESAHAVAQPAVLTADAHAQSTTNVSTDAVGGAAAESVRTRSQASQHAVGEAAPVVERTESSVRVSVQTQHVTVRTGD